MNGKYIIIALLLVLLGATIYGMLKFEESIRKERVVTVKIDDGNRRILPDIQQNELIGISANVDIRFKTSDDYFLIKETVIRNGESIDVFDTVFLKGVNIGAAMPGKFPSQFSLSFDEYLEWFDLIGSMNANVIRTYTILPPEFYEALMFYNSRNENRPLYLMQGVWATEPEEHDYLSGKYSEEFQREIADVIDVLHGNTVIEPSPGKSSGIYSADVSDHVIAILLGREWEPNAVTFTNNNNSIDHFNGTFISAPSVNPMEAWLAQMMEFTVRYETQVYNKQRPVSFVNWLPLDPMYHNTEYIENEKVREFDNDLESVDFEKFNATEHFNAGIYAAYHVYPYYPDYIYLKEEYRYTKNKKGNNDNYYGYLLDLKSRNKGLPLVIAEYGLPSSRGNSHYNPDGFHQGGLSEQEQALLSLQLTEDIADAGGAGAIYFEWIDEWFKFNWLVMDFEIPAERRKEWHNMENPEQNFGIMAVESNGPIIDGFGNEWSDLPEQNINDAVFSADAAYFNMLISLPQFDFNTKNIFIAVDTYSDTKGDHRLPLSDKLYENGYEFFLEFYSIDSARILVDDPYSVYTDIYNDSIPVYASKENDNGLFVEQLLLSNRGRRTILGDTIMPVLHNRSKLEHGRSDRAETSNASWVWNDSTHLLELRLTWHLLNVSDPSSHQVIDDLDATPQIEHTTTERFHLRFFITDKKGSIIDEFPQQAPYNYIWQGWEIPEYRTRLKPIYYTLQTYFEELDALPRRESLPVDDSFTITQFYLDKKAAVSLTFDDADLSQYELALPLLEKYKLFAGFGAIGEWLTESPAPFADSGSFRIRKMGLDQFRDISGKGHQVAFHGFYHKPYDIGLTAADLADSIKTEKRIMESDLGIRFNTIYYPFYSASNNVISAAEDAGFLFGRLGSGGSNEPERVSFLNIKGIPVVNDSTPTAKELYKNIQQSSGKWLVYVFRHIFPDDTKEFVALHQQYGSDSFTITPDQFERIIRLLRNADFWIAPISDIGSYLMQRRNSKIEFVEHQDLIFLTLVSDPAASDNSHPLTIAMTTDAEKVIVQNSAADGTYEVRNNKVFLNVYPNREVIIRKVF